MKLDKNQSSICHIGWGQKRLSKFLTCQLSIGFMNSVVTAELLPKNDTHRRIIHLDMDAFYASIEMRDNPILKNKALVIGQDPRQNNGHGVVATANYIARKFGVHSAMPSIKALQLIPAEKLVFLQPDFEKYHRVSAEIHELMYEITDMVQSIAWDEAYLDVTKNKLGLTSTVEIAVKLQTKIVQELGLTCSFGATYNKFLAKMGSEYAKPFGRTVILPGEAKEFLARQKLTNFYGIGPKTQAKLAEMGIYTGKDLQQTNVRTLIKYFNKLGYLMAAHANGIDPSRVVPDDEQKRKSIGIERTYEPCIYDQQTALTKLRNYTVTLSRKLEKSDLYAHTLVLKIRNNEFQTITKRQKLAHASRNSFEFYDVAKELFMPLANSFLSSGIRLLGITVTDFSKADFTNIDLDLFSD
ncbi:DNA polymerase IV [Lactobacillus sp. ESL0225]|nr:DNA polymerase IV [Lactobacillus sp. ESL0237]RMC43185.1 DNA polymerase IV [Lactobacillus sp. ESL0234]RMC44212.1 DNA polymerase IV [Lactobacillus sp. ESL0236]RMC45191.1 DNA polymerase IV [Lactobacillus sp. ESL0230]RMC49179.1 DNA polymerase IV [Lactobacillus sp. ESL0225]